MKEKELMLKKFNSALILTKDLNCRCYNHILCLREHYINIHKKAIL
jgi:hypothetical protein